MGLEHRIDQVIAATKSAGHGDRTVIVVIGLVESEDG